MARRLSQERWKRLRHPALLVSVVVFGVAFGLSASFLTYQDSLPKYLGRVVLIGLLWGLYWILAIALLTPAIMVPLGRWRGRRTASQYPAGSVTEVLLGTEDLVIVRPSGDRSEIAYARIRQVRTFGSLQAIYLRNTYWPTTLPTGALTEEALAHVHERMYGAPPAPDSLMTADPTRTFVAPPGWATHVAGVYTRANLGRPAFLVRFGLISLALLVLAVLVSPWCALVIPVLFVVVVLGGYVPTLRMLRRVVPDGSVATIEVLEDRVVYRNAGGAREIRYADVRSVAVRDDIVLMRLTTPRGAGVMPRALVPDDVLHRLGTPGGTDHPPE
jgi:hypothetical protein